jgi:deazaflavin-dependent oxidoreductase (nitroreductase family)
MTGLTRVRRAAARGIWRVMNPVAVRLAGLAPWWVVLETTGRQSGRPRRVPLARGPKSGSTTWLISVHGRQAGFARNISASPEVRLKVLGRWYPGKASLMPFDQTIVQRFNRYARMGPRTLGIDPALIRIELRIEGRGKNGHWTPWKEPLVVWGAQTRSPH